VSLPEALPPPPPPLSELIADRAEVHAALTRAKARASQVGAVEAMNKPMLGFGVELATMSDDWMMWPMLMFMVELPLASERRDAMLDEARATALAASANAEALSLEVRREVAERRAELEQALARHQSFATLLVPTQARRLDLALASFAAGQGDFDAVMMAATARNEARLGMLEAKVAALTAATGLDLALGRLVEAR
jgi:outer membrane protein TolC